MDQRRQYWRKHKAKPKPVKTALQSTREAITDYNSSSLSLLSSAKFTASRPRTSGSTARPSTARPRTGISSANNQDIVCAITESRGVTPVVGIALLNLNTCEMILWQISDSSQYVSTLQTLSVYEPQIIIVPAYGQNASIKLHSIIKACYGDFSRLEAIDRQYFTEAAGIELLQQLALPDDYEALRTQSLTVNYFAVCSFAAVIKYVDHALQIKFAAHSMKVSISAADGSAMIDESTRSSLELIQNLENHKSKLCLFGHLNRTETPMGARLLRTNILQPFIKRERIEARLNAVSELSTNEEAFIVIKRALKGFVDAEKVLTEIITIPNVERPKIKEQVVNRLIMLKTFLNGVEPVFAALTGLSSGLLVALREDCNPQMVAPAIQLLASILQEDTRYAKSAVELTKQRIYTVKPGIEDVIDLFRQMYEEAQNAIVEHVRDLQETHNISVELKFDARRQHWFRIPGTNNPRERLPSIFINVVKAKGYYQCQTITLINWNQKLRDAELEVLAASTTVVQTLTDQVRQYISQLYRTCEAISVIDVLTAFADIATAESYCLPRISKTLALKQCRHPIREKMQHQKFIPNDVYATQQTRFQVLTGANMSGKSTYIRTVVLATIMMQIGCFVPASYASFPIVHRIFARTSIDDSMEANASTFALEMREMAHILRNIDGHSMVIIDELGRGTSPQDGLAIAIAISEALIESKALVWFATHFKDLVKVLSNRPGVLPLYMSVSTNSQNNTMTMLYQIAEGVVPNNHYGIVFAKRFLLPQKMLQVASDVVDILDEKAKQKKTKSAAVIRLKKRKLILSLREHLEQAIESKMDGEPLRLWLTELQKEFILRMGEVDEMYEVIEDQDLSTSAKPDLDLDLTE